MTVISDNVYDVLTKVAGISGNAKQGFLKKFPETIPYLVAAYNPYIKYYLTSKSIGTPITAGTEFFTKRTWDMLELLSNRSLSGQQAITSVRTELCRLTAKSGKLLLGILDGDLRLGMGIKTLNKVFGNIIPNHDVMLAQKFEASRIAFPCFASPKLDGVRAKSKDGLLYSRKGHHFVGVSHIEEKLKSFHNDFDGELMIPGLSFQESSGLLRSDNESPTAILHLFEVPSIGASFKDRLRYAVSVSEWSSHIKVVPHKTINNMEELTMYYKKCRALGYEGTVVKSLEYQYQEKRSFDWMKMKPKETFDLWVIRVYEGEGKYTGQLGGVNVDFNDNTDNGVGSGFSDAERKRFWENPELIIGKVIEVECMELTNDGNMRHAVYKGIREDLN